MWYLSCLLIGSRLIHQRKHDIYLGLIKIRYAVSALTMCQMPSFDRASNVNALKKTQNY